MPSKPLIAHVVGARPNYMKIAPIWTELHRRGDFEQLMIHTGQHYDAGLKDVFFDELPLPKPDVELGIGSGKHGEQTGRALIELERVFLERRPDLVIVPGDVNSTLAAALAARKLDIDVCHVEAGLRSYDSSMPEEHNRRLTDHLSSLLLTHSESAVENLAREGIAGDRVAFVGNTMIDMLDETRARAEALEAWKPLGLTPGGYLLVTLHRPALVDVPELLGRTMTELARLAATMPVVFPIHPRTRGRLDEFGVTGDVILLDPLPYGQFLSLEANAAGVITDSGGVQEETTALGVPCFTLRDNTERPITVECGTNRLLGIDPAQLPTVLQLLDLPVTSRRPPLWDGHAGVRAGDAITQLLSRLSIT